MASDFADYSVFALAAAMTESYARQQNLVVENLPASHQLAKSIGLVTAKSTGGRNEDN
jgi:hypothetical protein